MQIIRVYRSSLTVRLIHTGKSLCDDNNNRMDLARAGVPLSRLLVRIRHQGTCRAVNKSRMF
jgi:hypothetical protein